MTTKLRILTAAVLLTASVAIAEDSQPPAIALTMPEIDWAVSIDVPGFEIDSYDITLDHHAARFFAKNEKTGVIMSGFLEKAAGKRDSKVCRDHYWSCAKESPFPKTDIKLSESGDKAIVQYTVEEYLDVKLKQKNMNIYMAEDGYWIDIHLSKTYYDEKDAEIFAKILNSVSIDGNYEPDSTMLLVFGTVYFNDEKYQRAVGYLERALAIENAGRTLPMAQWFMLVDTLGMSYGIPGNLEKAKATYKAGLARTPEYPMFHYNLACAYAEGNEDEKAIASLRLAHKYRDNVIPGTGLPDPRNDSSFRNLRKTESFEALAKEMYPD